MALTEQQKQEIKEQQSNQNTTKRDEMCEKTFSPGDDHQISLKT